MEPNEVNIPRWYLPSFNKQSVIKKIRDIIGSTPISVSFDDIENKPTTLAGYGITDAVNINSVGTATWKDYVDVIDRYGTNLPTESAVYSLVNTMITAAQPYQGVSSTEITNGGNQLPTIGGQVYTPKLGDIVAYNNKEFVWESTNTWRELGDEGSYALKTISVSAGTGLTGGGNLTEDRTIGLSSATQDDIAKGVTAYGWGDHSQAGYLTSETDPTVPLWAKQANKPSYTLDEVTDGSTRKLSDYLPLTAGSGKKLTGPLYFDVSSANKSIYANLSGGAFEAIRFTTDGHTYFGIGNNAGSRNMYLYGKLVQFTFGASSSTKSLVLDTGVIRPGSNSDVSLGTSSYKWKELYATTFYGNLALSYLTGADDLKAIEALTETSGFLKKTAANTWALTNDIEATSLKTTTEEDAMFTYRHTPSVAVGDMAKVLCVKGNTLVWNQMAVAQERIVTSAGARSEFFDSTIPLNHKIYISVQITKSTDFVATDQRVFLSNAGSTYGGQFYYTDVPTDNQPHRISAVVNNNNATNRNLYYYTGTLSSGRVTFTNPVVIDLTAMFGSTIAATMTAAEFEALYPLNYYDYSPNTLVNNSATGIEMLSSGGSNLGTFPLDITSLVPANKPTLRLNQLVQNGNFADGATSWDARYSTISASNNELTVTKTSTSYGGVARCLSWTLYTTHKYYISCYAKSNTSGVAADFGFLNNSSASGNTIFSTTSSTYTQLHGIVSPVATAHRLSLRTGVASSSVGANCSFMKVQCIDLTEMYGAGNEPTSTAEVEELIGTDYIPYNTGEDIPNRIFPVGMKSAGTAYDEWSGTIATRRIKKLVVSASNTVSNNNVGNSHERQYIVFSDAVAPAGSVVGNIICAKYSAATANETYNHSRDKIIAVSSSYFYIYDSELIGKTADEVKEALLGLEIYYESKNTETYTVYALPQLVACDPDGTQRRLPEDTASSVSAPMVCDFQYGVNPRDLYGEVKSEIAGVRNAIADILTQLPSSGKSEIPTEAPANPENTKTYIYYDDVNHKICVREKDGTVYSIQLST